MSSSDSDAEFLPLFDWLQKHAGLAFRDDQHRNTVATIRQLMKRAGVDDLTEYQSALRQRPRVLEDLVDQLTISETYFFREHQHFEFVRQQVIPDIRSRKGQAHSIAAWSAGCASGEEAYSLAIVFRQELVSPRATILATDLSTAALEKARQAVFRPWSFRGNASSAMRGYVTETGDQYTLRKDIKDQVRFERLNLAASTYPSPTSGTCNLDVIFCRNVLIYFESETVREISRRLLQCLAPGGWLITASGDPPLIDFANFDLVSTEHGVFYRRPLKTNAMAERTDKTDPRRLNRSPFPLSNQGTQKSESVRTDRSGQTQIAPVAQTHRQPMRTADSNIDRAAQTEVGEQKEDVDSRIAAAVAALRDGDHARAARLTQNLIHHPNACALHIKAVAVTDPDVALDACRNASVRHPLFEEIHYLHGVLLADANRNLEAVQAVRKAIFLNRSSVMSHFLFASIQYQQGQLKLARRHFRSVCELCATRKPDDVLPMSGGETVSDVAVAAESQLAQIEAILDP